MHHPNKDLVRVSREAAASVAKDCFGLNPEIELPTKRRHAVAQKFQWPQTEPRFRHDPLRGVQKTDESKYSRVASNLLQARKLAAVPVPHAKRAGQSIHSSS